MGSLRRLQPVLKTPSEERLPAGVQVPPTVYPRVSDEARHIPRHAGLVSSVQPLAAGVYFLAGAALLIHFAFNGRFGYFRDELYYAACGQHFSWATWITRRSPRGSLSLAVRFSAIRSLPCVSFQLSPLPRKSSSPDGSPAKSAVENSRSASLLLPF